MNTSLSTISLESGFRRQAVFGVWLLGLFLLVVFSLYAPLWALPALLGLALLVAAVFVNPYLGSLLMLFLIFSRLLQSFNVGRMFMAAVALTAAAWVANMGLRLDFRIRVLKSQTVLIFAFIFLLFLSIPFAYDTKLAFATVLLYVKLVLLYILFVNLLTTARRFEWCIYVVLFALLVAVGYGFYTFFVQPSLVAKVLRRVSGGGTDPNFFALSVISFLPLPFLFIFEKKKPWLKIFWLAVFLLMIGGILSSFSRAGILGLAFVLLVLGYKMRKHRVWFWLATGIILVLFFSVPGQIWDRMETLSNVGQDASLRWRFKLAVGAWELFWAHPLTGVGVGNFILFSFPWINRHQVAHNTYLEILAELGIFGLIVLGLLLWITFRYLRESYRSFRKNGQTRLATIGEGLEIGFWGFLFVAAFLSLHYDYMFWVFLGFAGALRQIAEVEATHAPSQLSAPQLAEKK